MCCLKKDAIFNSNKKNKIPLNEKIMLCKILRGKNYKIYFIANKHNLNK